MKCKEFRDLIITDYIDNELDEEKTRLVKNHLSVCDGCREYADELIETAVKPFHGLPRNAVPDEIWQKVRKRLAENKAAEKFSWFRFPRLAIVSVAATVMLITSFAIFKQTPSVSNESPHVFAQVNPYNEQNFYLTSSHQPSHGSDESFGTAIEECLL